MNQTLENLKTDAWRTASARYNAARRLRRRETFATVSLAFMSSLTIAMAFLQRVYATGTPADNYITFISAALGIFLLTVSLVEAGAKTGAVAEALHQNAEKLNGFRRRVGVELASKVQGSVTHDDVKRLNDEYEAIKDECQHNHLPVDDLYFRSHHVNAPEFLNGQPGPSMTEAEVLSAKRSWNIAGLWYIAAIWLLLVASLSPLLIPYMWRQPALTPATSSMPSNQAMLPAQKGNENGGAIK